MKKIWSKSWLVLLGITNLVLGVYYLVQSDMVLGVVYIVFSIFWGSLAFGFLIKNKDKNHGH